MSNKSIGVYNSRCKVCTSDNRVLIETFLARGIGAEVIALKVNAASPATKPISVDSIYRHRKHMGVELLDKLRAKTLGGLAKGRCDLESLRRDESESILQYIAGYRGQLDTLIDAAVFQGQLSVASSLIGRRNELLVVLARIVGELNNHAVNITNQTLVTSPSFITLRATLMRALAPFPAARQAVAKALAEAAALEDKSTTIEARVAAPPAGDATTAASDGATPETPARADIHLAIGDYSNGKTRE